MKNMKNFHRWKVCWFSGLYFEQENLKIQNIKCRISVNLRSTGVHEWSGYLLNLSMKRFPLNGLMNIQNGKGRSGTA